jgi:hypothetical protein
LSSGEPASQVVSDPQCPTGRGIIPVLAPPERCPGRNSGRLPDATMPQNAGESPRRAGVGESPPNSLPVGCLARGGPLLAALRRRFSVRKAKGGVEKGLLKRAQFCFGTLSFKNGLLGAFCLVAWLQQTTFPIDLRSYGRVEFILFYRVL